MSRFPVVLTGRRVLVVGAGPGAIATVAALRNADARLTVMPTGAVCPTLADLAVRGLIDLRDHDPTHDGVVTTHGPVAADDLAGVALVAACTGDADLDEQVGRVSEAAGIALLASGPDAAADDLRDARTAGSAGVTIVGGGPGDPGLLTLAGYRALAEADVVIADRLAPVGLLADLVPPPQLIDAAKIPGGPAMPQAEINRLLVEHAKAGRRVVRLKGGDPFVFGRGMEEMQACVSAGVAVDVIPGVSSATAVPGLAGIPVTHRGLTQAFTVVSGHVPPGHPDSQVDWTALARSDATLVLLMAVRNLSAIAAELLCAGLAGATPVVTVMNGASPQARCVRATLDTLDTVTAELHPPAVTVIGAVAAAMDVGVAPE